MPCSYPGMFCFLSVSCVQFPHIFPMGKIDSNRKEYLPVTGHRQHHPNTTAKHLYSFLDQQGLEILANKKAIEDAIDRGYARLDQSVAVWLDETM